MNVLVGIQEAIKLAAAARAAFDEVTAAINDDKSIVQSDELDEAKALLEKERGETSSARQRLKDAIAAARA